MEKLFKESRTSLLVPSVQEFSKESVSNVPQRYFQPQHQQQTLLISHESDATLQMPVIDMPKLVSQESGSSELIRLHLACKEWGFFQDFMPRLLLNRGRRSPLYCFGSDLN
ncbi:hypothetical protein LR48_Vigan10g070800 [Vigna angularis]|uniref:Non-haem dioxygenase N-terminal domain-containing protein n=1 Tax=Phaseolus angularis TaxID=3914 RepID=A0A0L9VIC9_PHAAN|nr:hypothetical protein LR48_Vigan10g070800 [Vigna angularis]